MMKIKESLLGVLLAYAGNALAADDAVSVADIEVPQGGSVELAIVLDNVTTNLMGWQCDLNFNNEGLTLELNAAGKPVTTLGSRFDTTGHSISSTLRSDGSYRFVATSMDAEAIPGTSGTLFTVTLEADASLEVGSTYVGTLSAIEFNTNDETPQTILISDATFTVTIGEPDDGRLKFDENATKLPKYTAGDKADITMKRTIKAGEWSTIVLPFNLTKKNAEAAFGSDVQFAQFAGFEVDYGDDEENVVPLGITINLTNYTIPARGNLAGGTPVLIKTSTDIDEIQIDGVTLTEGVKDVEKADEYDTPGLLTGTLVKSVIPADGLFISDNKFWYSTGKTNVKAFRCWFELGAVLDKETDFGARVIFNFLDSEQTGINDNKRETIDNKRETINDERCYDLQGRRVNASLVNSEKRVNSGFLKKGLYIVNGKKVIK